ncbi:hypothetical protein M405DRAFT_816071 [Rhizopogon salebrosus TDB-379]|nr:hypothetical protein M405DRAFT_816071 [Rhizopogon salebrosus TDB-379]
MGDDLPEPSVYHIFLKDVEGVAATLQGEDGLLHGVSTETPTKWTLTYVDREKGICMISDTKFGGFLGIKGNSVDVSTAVSLSEDQQTWIIKKADDGVSFIVGRTLADGQFGSWTLPTTGGHGVVEISLLGSVVKWVLKEVIVEAAKKVAGVLADTLKGG